MKALVYTGPESLDYREAADPVAANSGSVVKVDAVGICGSDMHAYLGHDARRPAPLILGHEAAGCLPDGRRVTVNPLVSCGACEDCRAGRANICKYRQIISMPPREGAFAEQVAVPNANLVSVPDHVSLEAAALTEPIACGYHAVRLGTHVMHAPLEEACCLVYGGGAIGLGVALVLQALGASNIWIAEPHKERAKLVSGLGDFKVFDPTNEAGPGEDSADLIIDGVGIAPTREAASAAARRGGVITHIGLGSGSGGLDIRRMTLQEITFIGTYTYTPEDFRETAKLLFDGKLGKLDWAEIRPLSEGARAFEDLKSGRVAAPKIVLVPQG